MSTDASVLIGVFRILIMRDSVNYTIVYTSRSGCGDTAGVANTNPVVLMMRIHTSVIPRKVVDRGLRESKWELPGMYQEESRILRPVSEMRVMATFLPMPIVFHSVEVRS